MTSEPLGSGVAVGLLDGGSDGLGDGESEGLLDGMIVGESVGSGELLNEGEGEGDTVGVVTMRRCGVRFPSRLEKLSAVVARSRTANVYVPDPLMKRVTSTLSQRLVPKRPERTYVDPCHGALRYVKRRSLHELPAEYTATPEVLLFHEYISSQAREIGADTETLKRRYAHWVG